ncbi:hypothetical protein [Nocardioides baculatus]|uniref:GTPase n=1 Tax=Nocardioides baculatus TaxID=2801337 RepID=A0ABS1L6F7_9ACTN|nr:hypothetical protein [Nocardioides baculatus]MBL0747092.1 hypothetical protein [Nocardioides baculatus]
MSHTITGLVGVYDADGGLLGEAAYVWGKVRGTRHCSLCDITHGTLRRKPEWDRMVAELGTPVDLVHLNEMPPDVRAAVAECGAPVVLARTVDGVQPLVRADELDDLHGSVDRLGTLLRERIEAAT